MDSIENPLYVPVLLLVLGSVRRPRRALAGAEGDEVALAGRVLRIRVHRHAR